LQTNPFHLLIAVIFLNKTRGAVAIPVFYNFITRFPDPSSLSVADLSEVVGFFQNLGLQNQRAKKCIGLAKAWMEHPPTKGKRWRRLHYPSLGDGKDIKSSEEPITDEDPRVAWEVGHLPGIGAYGIDSWRIFCRDELRGFGTAKLPELPGGDDDGSSRIELEKEEMEKEWTRVLPSDKELRAYLSSPYEEGKTLNLTVTEGLPPNKHAIKLQIVRLIQPNTLSCVMEVNVLEGLSSIKQAKHAILKLYDWRFATQLRQDNKVDQWTPYHEDKYRAFVEDGGAAKFISALEDDDDDPDDDEPWDTARDEAFLFDHCRDLHTCELETYNRLTDLQGKNIPQFFADVRFNASSPIIQNENDLFQIR
ncbi:MAG: hypothetical protein Q9180_007688, partial [Flavoplaca navasiana]